DLPFGALAFAALICSPNAGWLSTWNSPPSDRARRASSFSMLGRHDLVPRSLDRVLTARFAVARNLDWIAENMFSPPGNLASMSRSGSSGPRILADHRYPCIGPTEDIAIAGGRGHVVSKKCVADVCFHRRMMSGPGI